MRIARVRGIQYSWPDMDGWTLIEGRLASESEHESSARLVVLTQAVAERLCLMRILWGKFSELKGCDSKRSV